MTPAEHMTTWTDEQMQALHEALAAAHKLLDLPRGEGVESYKARQELLAERASSVRNALAGIVDVFNGDNQVPRSAALRGIRSYLDGER